MVSNKHMVDEDTVFEGIMKLEDLSLSDNCYAALYGICRNYYIKTFGHDLDEEKYKAVKNPLKIFAYAKERK